MDPNDPTVETFELGTPSPTLMLRSRSQVDSVIRSMFGQARRQICVRAERLTSEFFNSTDLPELVTPLITGDLRNRIHFLIDDAPHFLTHQPRIIGLARSFSSYVKVHQPLTGCPVSAEFFVTVDGVGYLHQPGEMEYPAQANPCAPAAAIKLERRFHEWWETSQCMDGLFTVGL